MNEEKHELEPSAGGEQPDEATGRTGRNMDEIRQIVALMRDNDLAEFKIEDHGFRLSVKRRVAAEPSVSAPGAALPQAAPAEVAPPEAESDDDCVEITSPIVGTFYRASAPEADALASVGDEVDEDTVVCIIEAMKVMNEVKAEIRGVIRAILVDNATSVQYGQPMFKVEPR